MRYRYLTARAHQSSILRHSDDWRQCMNWTKSIIMIIEENGGIGWIIGGNLTASLERLEGLLGSRRLHSVLKH